MKTFEIGKTYKTNSACNSNCEISYIVTARTKSTITAINNHGETEKFRINKKFSEYRKAETFLPWGNYSMCPMISAE